MTFPSFYQQFSQFHENQATIEWSITLKGNLVLWASVLLLLLDAPDYLPIIPLLLATQWFPMQRIWIMSLGLGGLFFHRKLLQLQVDDLLWFAFDAAVIVGLLFIFFQIAKSYSRLPRMVRNHPQIFLHAVLWVCILLVLFLPVNFRNDPAWVLVANLTACLVFFAFLIWRIGFMLYSGKRGLVKQTRFVDHLIYCLPYLGITQVPYGKGLDYLLPKMAKTRLDLAKSQLAGIKLLWLAEIWQLTLNFMDYTLFQTNGKPPDFPWLFPSGLYHIDELIAVGAQHMPNMGIVWSSLIMDMVYETTQLAVTGHLIIAALRLFGFNIFRNTYKPLLATSLIDFWNRYYYYFKELLVDFFFFPTYLTFFKTRPKLRVFAATMASAFLGNFYYHFLQHFDRLIIYGEILSFTKFYSYFFYAFVLGIGIFISILREQNQRGQSLTVRTPIMAHLVWLRKIAGVWIFISILHIWDHSTSSFMQDTAFFFSLFGISI